MKLSDIKSWYAEIKNGRMFGMRITHTADKGEAVCQAITGRVYGKKGFKGPNVVAGNFQAYGYTGASVFGIATEAYSASDGPSGHLLNEVSVISRNPWASTRRKRGIDVVFKNRSDGNRYKAIPGGVRDNHYNCYANAVVISSQQRSKEGEYCGWTAAIRLGPHALDRSSAQPYATIIDYRSCGRTSDGKLPYRFVWKHDGIEYGELYDPRTGEHEVWAGIDTNKRSLVKAW